jgi:antitoxin PrlF
MFTRIDVHVLAENPNRCKRPHMHRNGLRRNPPHVAVIDDLTAYLVRCARFPEPTVRNDRSTVQPTLIGCDQRKSTKITQRRLKTAARPRQSIGSVYPPSRPVEVREALGVDAGDRVEFVEIAPGRYEFIAATKSVTALKGMFGKPRKSVSIEEMNAAIARRGAAAK